MIIREAAILAGGMGTRLKSLVDDRPKPMALINGRPFLEYLIDWLITQGINRIIISAGYRHEIITGHFGSRYKSADILYAIEDEPLGTGGGLRLALRMAQSDTLLIVNGDTYFAANLTMLTDKFLEENADMVIALQPVDSGARYGSITLGENGRIQSFAEKSSTNEPAIINGGVYLMKRTLLENRNLPEVFSLEKDFLEKNARALKFFGLIFSEDFLDIGIPETYLAAGDFFDRSGKL